MTDMYRPRRATEIVDAAVQLYKRHLRTLVTISAVVHVPLLLLRTIAVSAYGSTADGSPANWGVSWALSMLDGLGFLLVSAALTVAADEAYMGSAPTIRASFSRGGSRFGAFFVATFLSSIAFLFGIVLLIFGAFYFLAKYGLSPTIAVLESRNGVDAMGRASKLSEERKRHVLAAIGAVWLIFFAVMIAAAAVSALVPITSAYLLFGTMVSLFVYPLVPVALVITYYDLRIRAEGYDIELLERQTGTARVAGDAAA